MSFGLLMGIVFPLFTLLFTSFESTLRLVVFSIGCVAAGLMVGFVAFKINSRSLLKTMRYISSVLEKMDQHNTETLSDVVVESNDELGEMSQAIWKALLYFESLERSSQGTVSSIIRLKAQLFDSIRQNQGAMDIVGRTISVMASASEEQEQGARQIQEDYKTLNSNILLNAASSLELYSYVREFGETLEQQRVKLNTVIEGLNSIGSQVGYGSSSEQQSLQNLSQQFTKASIETMETSQEIFQEVSEALEEIDNIADRTHVLSINASIEAARLGREGEGFRVIAGNIKGLSHEVQSLISSVGVTLKENDQRLIRITEELKDQMSQYQASIDSLGNRVVELVTHNQEIKDSSKQLNEGRSYMEELLQEIKTNMESLKSVIENSNNLVELGANSSLVINRGTQSLKESTQEMQIREEKTQGHMKELFENIERLQRELESKEGNKEMFQQEEEELLEEL